MACRVKISYLIVVAACLWPILHIYLASNGLISSWKLGGFGMYATASDTIDYSFHSFSQAESVITPPSTKEFRSELRSFLRWYSTIPGMADPADLFRSVSQTNPDSDCLRLKLERSRLSAISGRWEKSVRYFTVSALSNGSGADNG